jgi:DNA-binding NarL/FixJ family response regulator
MEIGDDRLPRDLSELRDRGLGSHALRHEALARLRRVVPVDAYCFSEVDPESQMMVAHATERIDRAVSARLYFNEYAETDFVKNRSLIEGSTRACSLSEATRGNLQRSTRFRELLAPVGVGDELRAACVQDGQAWGLLHLYRASGRSGFTRAETTTVARVTPLLAELLRTSVLEPGFTALPASRAPAVVVLDGANRIAESTGEAAVRLDALRDPEESGRRGLDTPDVLKQLAIRARASPQETDSAAVACARVRSSGGTWLALQASCMTATDGAADRVAVVISPATGPDLRPLLFSSRRLTPGEREVTELVVQGLSTREIAGELYLSPYTVQDRLKSIFEKFQVRSRRQLVARVHQNA